MIKTFIEKFEKIEKPQSFKDEDDLYTFANEAFSKIADEIENEIEINKEDYLDCEEWYDEYHDEAVQTFMQMLVG